MFSFLDFAWSIACTMSSARIAVFLYLSRSFQLVTWLWYHIRFDTLFYLAVRPLEADTR